jgi:hypothetical protein
VTQGDSRLRGNDGAFAGLRRCQALVYEGARRWLMAVPGAGL